jgi:hypothetical protein
MTADERLALIWQKVERAPDRPLLRQRGDVLLDAAWLPLRQRNHFQEPAKSGLKQGCGQVVSDQTTRFDHVGVIISLFNHHSRRKNLAGVRYKLGHFPMYSPLNVATYAVGEWRAEEVACRFVGHFSDMPGGRMMSPLKGRTDLLSEPGYFCYGPMIFRSLCGCFCKLLDDVKFNLCDPTSNHPQRIGRRM